MDLIDIAFGVLVLSVVLVFLGLYVRKSWTLQNGAGVELLKLQTNFAEDIRKRAARGKDPDWLRYSEECDWQHEHDCESLRNYATTALATGIGGTMIALIIVLYNSTPQTLDYRHVAGALAASGLGVLANLIILLRVLPKANQRFKSKREELLGELREVADEGQMGRPAPDTVSERLEEILLNVANNLPGVIEGFSKSVEGLGKFVGIFSASSEKVESATTVLSASADELTTLPEHLGNTLADARQSWANVIREGQEQYIAEFRQVLNDQRDRFAAAFSASTEMLESATRSLSNSANELKALPETLANKLADAQQSWTSDIRENQRHYLAEFQKVLDEQQKAVAAAFVDIAAKVASANSAMSESAAELGELPENFVKMLAEARQRWDNNVRENQKDYLAEFRQVLDEQQKAVAAALDDTAAKVASANTATLESAAELVALPENLGKMLAQARQRWDSDVRENQQGYLAKFRQVLDEQQMVIQALQRSQSESARAHQQAVVRLVNATSDVADAAKGLPRNFRHEVERSSNELGRVFGQSAAQQVSDLIDATKKQHKELEQVLEGHVQSILNQMGDVIHKGLRPTLDGVTAVAENTSNASTEVRRSIREFTDHGSAFKTSLDGAAGHIDECSRQLFDVQEKMQEAIAEFATSTEAFATSTDRVRFLLEDLAANRKPKWKKVLSRLRLSRLRLKRDNQENVES